MHCCHGKEWGVPELYCQISSMQSSNPFSSVHLSNLYDHHHVFCLLLELSHYMFKVICCDEPDITLLKRIKRRIKIN